MAIEKKSKIIDGHSFEVTTLPASRGFKMFNKLVKMIGPSMGGLIDSTNGAKNLLEADVGSDTFQRAMSEFVDRYDDDVVQDLLKQLLEVTMMDGKPFMPQFEAHFAGDITGLFKYFLFALEVQFGDFLSVLGTVTQTNVPQETQSS